MIESIPNCFYRVSVKGLILDDTRTKFLIVQEDNGKWELPGGGLDWGEEPAAGLKREIQEEMGIDVTWIAKNPCYFFTFKRLDFETQGASVFFEATLKNLEFTPSVECIALRFVSSAEVRTLDTFPNVQMLADIFDPAQHE